MKFPIPVVENVTVPVGVEGDPEVSVTVTLQLVGVFTIMDDGLHDTMVVVEAPADTVASSLVAR